MEKIGAAQISINNRAGFSIVSFTRRKNKTASRPDAFAFDAQNVEHNVNAHLMLRDPRLPGFV
jgi:hypothetical protein